MTRDLKLAISASLSAGNIIMKYYRDDYEIKEKGYQNPVTTADNEADSFLKSELTNARPDYGWLSEETVDSEDRLGKERVWIVDPLDGTKEFINRNGEFTVNIALIEQHNPVLGVVHLPAQRTTFVGYAAGASLIQDGGTWEAIACRPQPDAGMTALVSRSHRTPEVDDFLMKLNIKKEIRAGSSLKFCRVAEGIADIYPRFGRTMEWDTAAGHGVLQFAGG